MNIFNKLKELDWPDGRSIRTLGLTNAVINETSFLDEGVKMTQRLSCIYMGLKTPPLCSVCGEPNTYSTKKLYKGNPYAGWTLYCSKECTYESEDRMENFRNSMIENHGVPYSGMSKDLTEKRYETMEREHGAKHALQVDEIKQKQYDSMVCEYGGYTFESPVLSKKARGTMVREYGVEHARQNAELNQKAINTTKEYHGGDSPMSSAIVRMKVSSSLKNKSPEERKAIREKIRASSMKTKNRDHYSQSHITDDAYDILNSSDKLGNLYDELVTIDACSRFLGVDGKTIKSRLDFFDIPITRTFMESTGERELKNFISSLDVDFIENDKVVLDGLELDILIPSYNLAIEYNGVYWHSTKFKDKFYHMDKTDSCMLVGIQLIHVWDDDWKNPVKRKIIERMIRYKTDRVDKVVGARTLKIESTVPSDSNKFLDEFHIQGGSKGNFRYSLIDDEGEILSTIVFKDKRNGDFELVRFASSTPIAGAFMRLVSHFKKNHMWNTITTFADKGVSYGRMYEMCGFEKHDLGRPQLWYTDGKIRYRRERFMKHKLSSIFDNVDLSKTEEEIMRDNGFYSIYDAGMIKYVLRNNP